jgi:hypothetical protein
LLRLRAFSITLTLRWGQEAEKDRRTRVKGTQGKQLWVSKNQATLAASRVYIRLKSIILETSLRVIGVLKRYKRS